MMHSIDRCRAPYAMYAYGTDTDKVLAKGKQRGVNLCPVRARGSAPYESPNRTWLANSATG